MRALPHPDSQPRRLSGPRPRRLLLDPDVELAASRTVVGLVGDRAVARCVFTGRERRTRTDASVFVTPRLPVDSAYRELLGPPARWADIGLRTLEAVGDCWSPRTIAATRSLPPRGHRAGLRLTAAGPRCTRIYSGSSRL